MAQILIIDDDPSICTTLIRSFKHIKTDASSAYTLKEGIDKIFSNTFDVVFLDVNLPDGNGLDAIKIIQQHDFPPEIIIMTGDAKLDGAELAMKSKAWDYIQKSQSIKEFQFSMSKALEYRKEKQLSASEPTIARDAIIGESREIKGCLDKVSKASAGDMPVLITGETGTGKEVFAKSIHQNSQRAQRDFIVVDCASMPEHLVESILFGHVKGAFTGADRDRTGLIQMADNGTLFLDEVGELPLLIQKKFLRVLQEKRFRPVGGKKEETSNFRLISATHRNLADMVKKKDFRQDFYFRIASFAIHLPPLRERKSDIPALTAYYMDRKIELFDEKPHKVSKDFMQELETFHWPGNVRELFNVIDYAISDAFNESILFAKHLPDHIRIANIQKKIQQDTPSEKKETHQKQVAVDTLSLKAYIEQEKCRYLTELIEYTDNDIKTACRLSGLSRGHLYSLFKKYNIQPQ